MPEDFKVRVGEFEGPLEVLLELIEKRKLHISTVSLSKVADDFIEFTNNIESKDEDYMSDLSDFILIASTLLLIKSKSLLPNLDLTEEEQISIENLEDRLTQYKKYRELSLEIGKIFGNFCFFPLEKRSYFRFFAPTDEINLTNLKESLERSIEKAPIKKDRLPKVNVKKMISLEEMIEKLVEKIKSSIKMNFSDFAKISTDKKYFSEIDKSKRIEIIVSFLAMLELVKRGIVRVNQDNHFRDIEIESENTSVPSYI